MPGFDLILCYADKLSRSRMAAKQYFESTTSQLAIAMANDAGSPTGSLTSDSSSSASSLPSLSPSSSQSPEQWSTPPPPPNSANTSPSRTKLVLFAFFALGAFFAWSLGVWETVLMKVSIRARLRPLLLFVGDSLTERGSIPSSMGWITMLESDCKRSIDVVSRGLSGYNTKWYLKYAMPVIQDEITSGNYMPTLVTIWLGANDAALPNGSMAEQHVPIAAYQMNLAKLVHTFKVIAPHTSILLVTPPHVDDAVQKSNAKNEEGHKKGLVSRSNAATGEYARACVDTAKGLGVPVLDLYSYFNNMTESERNDMLMDGLHFNETANREMYLQLREKINTEFPDLGRKLERWQLPPFEDWAERDPWSPEESTTLDFTSVRMLEKPLYQDGIFRDTRSSSRTPHSIMWQPKERLAENRPVSFPCGQEALTASCDGDRPHQWHNISAVDTLGQLLTCEPVMVYASESPTVSDSSSSENSSPPLSPSSSQPSQPSPQLWPKSHPLPRAANTSLHQRIKFILFVILVLGAFAAWLLGAWEPIMTRIGIRPRLRPVLLLVGDSLTEKGMIPSSMGWVSMLESDCRRSIDVVSRGLAGYNTKWYLKYAMPIIQDEITNGNYMPALITIWLGANDAALPDGSKPETHVPIAAYQSNLVKLVYDFQAVAPSASIRLITPPHVGDAKGATKKGLVGHSNKMTGTYARACADTASELGVPVLNLYSHFNNMTKSERNNLLEDGLHFNEAGNDEVYQQLREKIASEFPDVSRMFNRWTFPPYEDFVKTDAWAPDENTTLVDFTNVHIRS
ncbi:unnamed protein product [Phytophthora fragariaefolia]|uniref:Unnamed protein product n=1 Tax=Phytophthora fragariaefolia TaxID=1490495 RepID=A0A9W6XRH1_9STRA|nr:unnamed protein product [Phytophthora fragariaefolia]